MSNGFEPVNTGVTQEVIAHQPTSTHHMLDSAMTLGVCVSPASKALDGFVNPLYKIGQTAQNGSNANQYFIARYSKNESVASQVYRGSWLARHCVNLVAEDMLRGGIEIKGVDVDQAEELQSMWLEYGLDQKLEELIINGRLFGGAIGVIVVDGQEWGTTLNIDRVGKDAFAGFVVFDRWRVSTLPTYNPITQLPTSYNLDLLTIDADPTLKVTKKMNTAQNGGLMWVDSTRCLRYDGDYLPYWDFINNMHWHASVLDRLMETIDNYNVSSSSLVSMTRNATQKVFKIANLSQKLAQSSTVGSHGNLEKILEKMTVSAGVEGITVVDADSDISLLINSFEGAVSANENLRLDLCANIGGAPYTKVFGNSASGMNATGEGDTRNWYDSIEAKRRQLMPGVLKLLKVMYRSKFGKSPPPSFRFNFKPLWQSSDAEKADILAKKTQAVVSVYQAGVVNEKVALEELRKFDEVHGMFGAITDEDIELAANQEPPAPEMLGGEVSGDVVDDATMGEVDGQEK